MQLNVTINDIELLRKKLPNHAFNRRAAHRRIELGLSVLQVHKTTGIDYGLLNSWERYILIYREWDGASTLNAHDLITWNYLLANEYRPPKFTEEIQSLWELALRVPSGWLLNSSIPGPNNDHLRDDSGVIPLQAQTVRGELVKACVFFSQFRSPEDMTLDFDLLTNDERERVEIMTIRYGLFEQDKYPNIKVSPGKKVSYKLISETLGLPQSQLRKTVLKMTQWSLGGGNILRFALIEKLILLSFAPKGSQGDEASLLGGIHQENALMFFEDENITWYVAGNKGNK